LPAKVARLPMVVAEAATVAEADQAAGRPVNYKYRK